MSDTITTLQNAERFIVGFEDDDMQEGIPELLADIRAAIMRECKALGLHFRLFQASRMRSENLDADFSLGIDRGGYAYTTENVKAYIEDHADPIKYKHLLTIGAGQWESDNLEYLEKILWACHVLWEDPKELEGENLDVFIEGWCSAHNIVIDGDIFAREFGRHQAWMPVEVRTQIEIMAETYFPRNKIGGKMRTPWERRGTSIYTKEARGRGSAVLIIELHGRPDAVDEAQRLVDRHNQDAGF